MNEALQAKHPQMTEIFGDTPTSFTWIGKEALRLRRLCREAFLGMARKLIFREDTEVIDIGGKDTEKLTHPITFKIGNRSFDVRVREYTAMHTYSYPVLHQDVHTSIRVTDQSAGIDHILFNVTQQYYPHKIGETPDEIFNSYVTNDRNKRATGHEVFRGLVAINRIAAILSETQPQSSSV